MRVGLDVYSIHHLKLDPFQTLHFAVEHKLDGVQFHWPGEISPTLDSGKLAEIRQEANRLGLYLEVGLPTINPYHFDSERAAQVKALGDGDYVRGIVKVIEAAQGIGCHELRTNIGAREDRLDPTWPAQVRAATAVIQQLRSVLLNGGSRINVENHADATTFELVRLVENAGPDIAGICLDVGNVCRQLEDPVRAAQRAAPYVHLTHTKDAILFFTECGLAWQARP
ncbi:MAG TPA: TIM barrel protein, partial [Chloroflexota bacterium]|nr:TIM barrel protein [Chloroflexota bacterium]